VLDGEGTGPVTNLAVMSRVSERYAPPDRHLVSATVLGKRDPTPSLLHEVRAQMRDWFGPAADDWREIRSYGIDDALPDQTPSAGGVSTRPVLTESGLFVCGDHRVHGSIEGAIQSGLRAAEGAIVRLEVSG
jgi:predicted NAD/FAD-dependent oxidoreductase